MKPWAVYTRKPCAALGLALITACAERDFWMGRRCADGLLTCADAGVAALPDASDGRVCPCDGGVCPACEPAPESHGLCVAGHYGIDFSATYTPAAAGACGLFNVYGGMGSGRWDVSLEPSDDPDVYSLGSSGCQLAWPAPDGGVGVDASTDAPDSGVLSGSALLYGSVNCVNGELTATIKGTYRSVSVCTLGTLADDYFYKGSIQAVYVAATGRFEGGTISVREPANALGDVPGGFGTFSALRLGPGRELDPVDANCYGGLTFPEAKFP